ncbi:DUF1294 domain-containing protein [Paenibacillus thailandensis]|uniref:DUF1294 domain-containing protein n=1 Tax=Paenibacillus thailandensis TaxID=393250 RepID=A0ABW5R107_9BACL
MDSFGILLIYIALINIVGFASMGADKQYARSSRRRIPEKRLFALGWIGGALGVWIGMRVWRHKTKHRSFVVGIPLLLALNVAVVVCLLRLMA